MLSFVVVVRVRVKVVREIFFVFWVFFVSVLAEKNKNTTDCGLFMQTSEEELVVLRKAA